MNDALHAAAVLTIPGWNGSGPGHWQSLWEQQHGFRRVEQSNWSRPTRGEWVEEIARGVDRAPERTYLVAHSLGCLAVALWAADHDTSRIRGALLVAPPWLDQSESCPSELAAFLPMPVEPLPFASLFVASENDPYLPLPLACRLSKAWGSDFVNVGRQGHINTASGHGPWPTGERLLERLTRFQRRQGY